jgi:hypothetical protein
MQNAGYAECCSIPHTNSMVSDTAVFSAVCALQDAVGMLSPVLGADMCANS